MDSLPLPKLWKLSKRLLSVPYCGTSRQETLQLNPQAKIVQLTPEDIRKAKSSLLYCILLLLSRRCATFISSRLVLSRLVRSGLFWPKTKRGHGNIDARGILGGGDPSRGGSFYRPGVKKLGYFYTFSAPKAPKMCFLRRRRRREKFLSTFFEIFGKFVNKNAIKSDFWGVVCRYISKISKKSSILGKKYFYTRTKISKVFLQRWGHPPPKKSPWSILQRQSSSKPLYGLGFGIYVASKCQNFKRLPRSESRLAPKRYLTSEIQRLWNIALASKAY